MNVLRSYYAIMALHWREYGIRHQGHARELSEVVYSLHRNGVSEARVIAAAGCSTLFASDDVTRWWALLGTATFLEAAVGPHPDWPEFYSRMHAAIGPQEIYDCVNSWPSPADDSSQT